MKKEDRDEVRRMREVNLKRIEEIKNKSLMLNRERHSRVKLIESSSKINIDKFWTNHMQNIARS